jgi:hypothetical protein
MFNFEKLEVWREAMDFADFVYSITRAFPDEDRFGPRRSLLEHSV